MPRQPFDRPGSFPPLDFPPDVPWVTVDSTNVAAFRWAQGEGGGYLEVRFTNGGQYQYLGVDRGTFERMKSAPSLGEFVYESIRQFGYAYVKVV